ncbi:MAG: hypothetical protein KF894_18105 [Labilithrix sp.]|nr:hypothetical protein [Labilithrix sp.]
MSARAARCSSFVPASMPTTNTRAGVAPLAAATIAGPGQKPPSAHPTPKSAAPRTSRASMPSRAGR